MSKDYNPYDQTLRFGMKLSLLDLTNIHSTLEYALKQGEGFVGCKAEEKERCVNQVRDLMCRVAATETAAANLLRAEVTLDRMEREGR